MTYVLDRHPVLDPRCSGVDCCWSRTPLRSSCARVALCTVKDSHTLPVFDDGRTFRAGKQVARPQSIRGMKPRALAASTADFLVPLARVNLFGVDRVHGEIA